MTLSDFDALLQSVPGMDGKVAYRAFPPGKAPPLPFITYLEGRPEGFQADNTVYFTAKNVDIELYTKCRDETLEGLLEKAMKGAGLVWGKDIDYLDSEQCYMIVYAVTI